MFSCLAFSTVSVPRFRVLTQCSKDMANQGAHPGFPLSRRLVSPYIWFPFDHSVCHPVGLDHPVWCYHPILFYHIVPIYQPDFIYNPLFDSPPCFFLHCFQISSSRYPWIRHLASEIRKNPQSQNLWFGCQAHRTHSFCFFSHTLKCLSIRDSPTFQPESFYPPVRYLSGNIGQ